MRKKDKRGVRMALRATANKLASTYSSSLEKRDEKTRTKFMMMEMGRRGFLLSTVLSAAQVNDSSNELLQKYLKRSQENKTKNDKERLDSYYKRNYKDYFDFVEGGLKGKNEQQLSESEKGILDWLKRNK